MTSSEPVCVVGAGACGIVSVKVLLERGIPVRAFERGSDLGGNWRFGNDNGQSAAYRSLHINTSKGRMAFSDFPMPAEWPAYPHHTQVLEYFERYAARFGVRERIAFGTTVTRVAPAADGAWEVTTEPGGTRRYRAVLVANGHHWRKKLPSFPGRFDGPTLHAHDYRDPDDPVDLAGRRVLVVGIGNSGVDVACDAARVAASTLLSTRRGAHVLPKFAFGRPIDELTTPFGSRLPPWLQQLGFQAILRLARGDQARLGIPVPAHPLMAAHPTLSSDFLNAVGHGKVRVVPDVAELRGDRVVFADGREEPVDVVVYATGYHIAFPFLDPAVVDPEANEVRLYRHVVHPARPGLYFIGLIQPLGAVMPLAELQAEWVAGLLDGSCALPARAAMERAIDRDREAVRRRYVASTRHTIQVDFFPYARRLRRETRRRPDPAVRSRRAASPRGAAAG